MPQHIREIYGRAMATLIWDGNFKFDMYTSHLDANGDISPMVNCHFKKDTIVSRYICSCSFHRCISMPTRWFNFEGMSLMMMPSMGVVSSQVQIVGFYLDCWRAAHTRQKREC